MNWEDLIADLKLVIIYLLNFLQFSLSLYMYYYQISWNVEWKEEVKTHAGKYIKIKKKLTFLANFRESEKKLFNLQFKLLFVKVISTIPNYVHEWGRCRSVSKWPPRNWCLSFNPVAALSRDHYGTYLIQELSINCCCPHFQSIELRKIENLNAWDMSLMFSFILSRGCPSCWFSLADCPINTNKLQYRSYILNQL